MYEQGGCQYLQQEPGGWCGKGGGVVGGPSHQDEEGTTGCKGGDDEFWGHQGTVPEWSGGVAGEHEGGDGVNGESQEDGNDGPDPRRFFFRDLFFFAGVGLVKHQTKIEEEIG